MDQIYEILIHKVHDYEGTVNEFTGDGIMALFGAPIALEDAPQRAIRSAYAIHREMTRFNDKMKQEKANIPPIRMRIGIHTGPVVVGTLGNDLRVEFKAVGDTVNLAARMEGLAESGATYVSEDTFKLTEGLFRYEALGEYAVKGKADTVKAYRVIAPSTSRTRFDVSAERGLTPFVGRERELELLLDGFERAKTGRGQAISIMAEAGVGKSRLLYEFRKAVSNEDVTFQEGKCLSYSRGVAYHPIIDVVKANFDIVEGDGDFEIREKLKRGLKVLGAEEASTLPYFLEFLSVKDSGVDPISLSPEGRKDRIIEALNRSTIMASQIRPLIMAIEDLHWIDKSSEDTLKTLLDSISGERIFLIFTYRPEYVHTWGAKSYHSQVNLNRLSNRESLAMVIHLLGTEDIGGDFEELILEKTEGVPFFIEEFLKSLKDLNVIERKNNTYHLVKDIQAFVIPSTIQDVIMARVDTLPEGAKELIQTGSVIEREFSYALMKLVSNLSEKELLSRLSILKDSELLFERGIYPENTYIFKHALTQEVVYNSILARKTKELHNKIGQAIEQLYKDNLHEHYGVLAEHFISSENFEKGAEYCRLAGKMARKAASRYEAIAYLNRSIACFEKLPQTDKMQKKLIDARTNLGILYIEINNFNEAKDAVDPMIDIALREGSKRRISQINTIMGAFFTWSQEDFPKAFEYLNKALKISEEINDIVSTVLASYWLGMACSYNANFAEANNYLQKAVDIVVTANSKWAISTNISSVGFNHNLHGRIDLGYQSSEKAFALAEECRDILSLGAAYINHGVSCYSKGFLEKAKHLLLKGLNCYAVLSVHVWKAMAHQYLGETYFEMEKYQESMDHYRQASLILEDNNILSSMSNLNKIGIAKA
jgi:tetratricopeptide (TPR) repeat protein